MTTFTPSAPAPAKAPDVLVNWSLLRKKIKHSRLRRPLAYAVFGILFGLMFYWLELKEHPPLQDLISVPVAVLCFFLSAQILYIKRWWYLYTLLWIAVGFSPYFVPYILDNVLPEILPYVLPHIPSWVLPHVLPYIHSYYHG